MSGGGSTVTFLALVITVCVIVLIGLFAYNTASAEVIVYDSVSDWHVYGLPQGYSQTCVTIDRQPYLMIFNTDGEFKLFKISEQISD